MEHEGKRGLGGNGQPGNKGAPQNTRTVQDEEEEVRCEDERQSSNGTCDNLRKGAEHKRKKQRKCGMSQERTSASRSGQIAAMTSRKARGDR